MSRAAARRRSPPPAAAPLGHGLDQDDKVLVAANDIVGIFQIISFGKGVYLPLAGALSLILAASACVMGSARLLGELVQGLVGGRGDAMLPYAATFLALETLSVGCQYFGRVSLAKATIEIIYRIRFELFAKMQRLAVSYFDVTPLGRTITRLTSDVEGIETFFSGTLARVLIACINIAMVLGAMLLTNLHFGSLIVAVSLPALVFSVILRKPVIFWLRTYKRRSAHLNAKLAEFLNGLPVIRIFGLEAWTKRLFDEAADELLHAGLTAMSWNSFIRPVALFLCSLPTLLILWKGGEQVLAGTLELGTLVAFVRYSERFISPIRVISTEIQNIQEAVVSSERVRRMLKEPEEAQTLGPDGQARPELAGMVEYQDVWMNYGDGGEPVLKGVDFTAQPGMKVALVGATGSGKTTTVNLLPRLYPFQRGRILLDGLPIEALARDGLRCQLGYVSQDVVVFAGTVRQNLLASALGEPPSDEQIRAACRKTGLDQVLAGLAAGLDHLVVEGGENLSMGERQLIAFTRMMLRDPRILILDEATANIDEHCERLIQAAISEVMAGRTCFVIAHRLSTIIQCDLILVFAHGKIVERGTHAELMGMGGVYAGLAGKQMLA